MSLHYLRERMKPEVPRYRVADCPHFDPQRTPLTIEQVRRLQAGHVVRCPGCGAMLRSSGD